MGNCKHFEICGLSDDADPKEGLCILHSRDPEKNKKAFEQALEGHRQKKGDNFELFVFPDTANFLETTFTEEASFVEATFNKGANFRGAGFNKGANFRGSRFSEEAAFLGATFNKWANFGSAKFTKGASFVAATFTNGANFGSANFTKGAEFIGAKFSEEAVFLETKFSEEAIFLETKFIGGASFGGAKFTERARFSEAMFTKQAYFNGATFIDEAIFNAARFIERARFSEVKFNGGANFVDTMFNKEATFIAATFTNAPLFLGPTFTNEAYFNDARFTNRVYFVEATFTKAAHFEGATFTKGATFRSTRFLSGALFQDVIFGAGEVNFESSTFNGRTLFVQRPKEEPKGEMNAEGKPKEKVTVKIFSGTQEVNFKSVNLDLADSIIFREADLQKCLFLDTNLQKINFIGVKWHDFGGREGVYDETFLEKGKADPWDGVERLYRELKKNYEDNRDYERAGHFHYGEKEVRRKNPQTSQGLKFLLTIYKWFSGYGESWARPLICIGLLLGFSTFGFLSLGIFPQAGGPQLTWTNPVDWLHGFHYSFRVMTLLKPDDFCLGDWAKVIHTTQSVLGPLFITLLALAIRQKLKR